MIEGGVHDGSQQHYRQGEPQAEPQTLAPIELDDVQHRAQQGDQQAHRVHQHHGEHQHQREEQKIHRRMIAGKGIGHGADPPFVVRWAKRSRGNEVSLPRPFFRVISRPVCCVPDCGVQVEQVF